MCVELYRWSIELEGIFVLPLAPRWVRHSYLSKKATNDPLNLWVINSGTYLWHCRLGHIGVKRMKKLHVDGLLESLDYESFDTCEPCFMGKMTKTPLSETMERANDLLEIIHTDV